MGKQFIMVMIAIVVGLISMSGCTDVLQHLQQNPQKLNDEDYQKHLFNSQDRYLSERLAAANQFPDSDKQLSPWFISIKQNHFRKASALDTNWRGAFREYMRGFDVTTDVIGRAYLAATKERGNIVKMYNSDISDHFVAIVSKNVEGYSRSIRHNDWNNALIECNQNGRMVSALVRQNRTHVELKEAFLDFYSFIVFGDGMRLFEQTVSNTEINNAFLQQL